MAVSELSQYAVSQLAMNAMPPDPGFWGDGGETRWRERLERRRRGCSRWLRHQIDGPYWRQGSLAPDYDAIEAADLPHRGLERLVRRPGVPDAGALHERARSRRTLVGNWVHSYPSDAYPGPNLDWLHELTRFFDRHLKGLDNGWDEEPGLVWFERDYAVPEPFPRDVAGSLARGDVASRWTAPATAAGTRRPAGRLVATDPGAPGTVDAAAPRDRGDVGCAVVGRGLAPERPRTRPPPGRGAGPDVTSRPARRAAVDRRLPGRRRSDVAASMPVATLVRPAVATSPPTGPPRSSPRAC